MIITPTHGINLEKVDTTKACKIDENFVVLLGKCQNTKKNYLVKYAKRLSRVEMEGVGGHLFAIASELSLKHGYDGFLYAEAMDQELYDYYCSEFQALKLPPIDNPYRFMMSDEVTARIREVYSYEWTDEII